VTIRESVVSPVVCVASEHGPVTHTRKLEVVRWSYGILRMPNSDNHICLPGWFLLSAVRALGKEAASVFCCLAKSVREEAGYSPTGGQLTSQNTQGHFQSPSYSPVLIHFAYTT